MTNPMDTMGDGMRVVAAAKGGEETLLTFNSLPPTNLAPPECHQTKHGVQQMFLSQLSGSDSGWGGGSSHGVRIDCGSIAKDEKNWIGFAHEGRLFYVYSIFPHVILQVRPADGACVQRWSTSYAPLIEASMAAGGGGDSRQRRGRPAQGQCHRHRVLCGSPALCDRERQGVHHHGLQV